jgi:hypothetical protein
MDDYSDVDRKFWTNLHGARWRYIDGSGDYYGYGVDNVNIHLTCTHGGAWSSPDRFTVVMWDEDVRAFSTEMRLGDDGRKLGIYAAYSCSTMNDDGSIWNRWSPVFKGGLKYASAFWGAAWSANGAKNTGKSYAEKLHTSGYALKYAWLDSMDDYTGNTPAIMASGTSSTNCSSRRNNMTWSNYKNDTTYPRLRDSSVTNLCWTRRQA